MAHMDDYRSIAGDQTVDELLLLAERLAGTCIQNINSTKAGGGVAEILRSMIPLMQDIGLDMRWDTIEGDQRFFDITKKTHNALHGVPTRVGGDDFDYFMEINRRNSRKMTTWGDMVIIHDPQPIGLVVEKRKLKNRWAWRCHIDFSGPQQNVWAFLKKHIRKYDASVFSVPQFSRPLPVPQVCIAPSIDPLSDKNRPIDPAYTTAVLQQYGIDPEKPIITQVSRFDYLKDPLGVIEAYRQVRRYIDCQLVLLGGGADDDPEGAQVLERVMAAAEDDKDIFVLFLPPDSHLIVNAVQRASSVVLQKSLKEGFGLTVSEALWKEKPVIAGAVGGIPRQITHKFSGILTYTVEGTAYWIKRLLNEPEYARGLARNGKQHIKNNFLITRHLQDYLTLFLSLQNSDEVVRFH